MTKVILFNKPFNVLSQFTDESELQANRHTLKSFIELDDVYPAGRLDRDSEGLLVLTDSGTLQNKLSDPLHKVSKTYWAQVEGEPCDADLVPLRNGLQLKDGVTKPARAELIEEPNLWQRHPPIRERKNIPTSWLSVTLSEGKNRQVRRMCAAIGFPVLRLVRYRVASWTIDGIPQGEWRSVHLRSSPDPEPDH